MSVPKPPKKREISPDVRMDRLLEWKRLFEEISPEVHVHLNSLDRKDKDFRSKLQVCIGKHFRGFYSDQAHILITIGDSKHDGLWYLVGSGYKMFSNDEVDEQVAGQEEHDDSFFWPNTKPWKDWYVIVCDMYEKSYNSIPKPPTLKAGK